MSIPKSLGRLLIQNDDGEEEEFRIYTLEEANALILRLPQAVRRTTNDEILVYKNWKEAEWRKKVAYAKKNIEVCKPGWKDIYSSAKDRDSAILLDPEVQKAEQECLEAEILYKKAVAVREQVYENLLAVKKIYETFLRDDMNIRKYPTYGGLDEQ